MVQERFGATLVKGAAYQSTKKEKDGGAASVSHKVPNKPMDGKYGAWGPVFKNKQNFVDMHYS
jgi:hypothetical protein